MGISRLKKRQAFLAIARSGRRFFSSSFLLQSKKKHKNGDACFGFTATRRLGGAVKRNRARRRLKAAVEVILREKFPLVQDNDYVLIARPDIFRAPFEQLVMVLKKGLSEVPSSQKIKK